jgi:hypothetical protein
MAAVLLHLGTRNPYMDTYQRQEGRITWAAGTQAYPVFPNAAEGTMDVHYDVEHTTNGVLCETCTEATWNEGRPIFHATFDHARECLDSRARIEQEYASEAPARRLGLI